MPQRNADPSKHLNGAKEFYFAARRASYCSSVQQAARRTMPSQISQREEVQQRRLKEDLTYARKAVFALLDEHVRQVAQGLLSIRSDDDLSEWEGKLIEAIMQKAVPLPPDTYTSSSSSSRARCPLCGASSSSPYETGFALPDGLRRHLAGDGNSRRCSVTEALWRFSLSRLETARR